MAKKAKAVTDAAASPAPTAPKKAVRKQKAAKRAAAVAKPTAKRANAPKKKRRAVRSGKRVTANNGGVAHVSRLVTAASKALAKEHKRLAAVKAEIKSLQKAVA